MLALSINNLAKSYHVPLFRDFTIQVEGEGVIGLIGDNGSGKSTLLRILAGVETADGGGYRFHEASVGYLPQEIESLPELSGGQKKIQELRRLFFKEKRNVVLLDEPDNHLDIENKIWLEEVIKNFRGLVIIISHDRKLLANVTDRVWLVAEEKVNDYKFGYQKFSDFYQDELEQRFHLFKVQEKERQRLEKLVEVFRARAAANDKLVGQYHNMEKRLERFEREMAAPPPETKNSLGIEVDLGKQHRRKTAIFASGISKSYGDKQVLNDLRFHLFCGEKVAIMGPNGRGKSTLLKILAKVLLPDQGEVEYGPQLRFGYFSQEHYEALDQRKTPAEILQSAKPGLLVDQARYLERFLFRKETSNTPVKYLSGGQRSRVQLAKFLVLDPEILLLDEPTNHLDIQSTEVLEKFLIEYQGGFVLISHDRQLVANVASKIYTIEEGKLREAF